MPEWLSKPFQTTVDLTPLVIAERLVAAVVFGLLVGLLYRFTFGRKKADASPFTVTLVLLAVLVAMTTLVIGDNAARAFSLVGTLAIVRFRTVVDDTRDTAFVIFAVAVGMGAGAGSVIVVLIGLPLIAIVVITAAAAVSMTNGFGPDRTLNVKAAPDTDVNLLLAPLFASSGIRHQVAGVEMNPKGGDTIEVSYHVRFRDTHSMVPFVVAVKKLPGIQSVEVKGKA